MTPFPIMSATSASTSLAPSLSLVAFAAVGAHVARLAAPRDSPYVFASASNGAYIAAALLCPMDDGALALTLIGAASLAHHAEPDRRQAHTLDLALGWVLVMHLAFAPLLAGARVFAQRVSWWVRMLGRIAAYAVWGAALAVLFSHYVELIDDPTFVGNGQILLYIIVGPIAALALGLERIFILTKGNPPDSSQTPVLTPYLEAAIETLVVLLMINAAVVAQGTLLGRQLFNKPEDVDAYDIFHGQWHILIAFVAIICYRRVYEVNQYSKGQLKTCVCHAQWPELAMLAALAFHSVLVIVLKEAAVSAGASEATLGVSVTLLCAFSAYAWWQSMRASPPASRAFEALHTPSVVQAPALFPPTPLISVGTARAGRLLIGKGVDLNYL